MKKYKLYLYLILAIIISSCSNDEGIDNTPELGLLKKLKALLTEVYQDQLNYHMTRIIGLVP